ncbi:MAG: adenylate/guanylate cyclase domain-containing protein [Armatimonadota bacterium]
MKRLAYSAIALWAGLILIAYYWPGQTTMDRMELYTVDWRFRVRGEQQPDPRIVVVAVDETSIRQIGRWPWPRRHLALLVRRLDALGAKRCIFDTFFVDPQETGDDDRLLARATRDFGSVYHAGMVYEPDEASAGGSLGDHIIERMWDDVPVTSGGGLASGAALYEARAVDMPLEILVKPAAGVGVMNVLDSGDGVFRHILPVVRYREHLIPSAVLVAACDILGVPQSDISVQTGRCINLGERSKVPIDLHGRMMVNFAGGRLTYPRVSAAKLLQDTVPDDARQTLKDKTVFVGVTAPGFMDLRPAPFDSVFNGVETQANALDTVLNEKFIRQVSPLTVGVFIIVIAALFATLLLHMRTTVLLLVSAALYAGYITACVLMFLWAGMLADMLAPSILMIGCFVILVGLRLVGEERRRHQVQQTLARFVPPSLADDLVIADAAETLKGQRRVITCMFADIRGFTSASAGADPEAIVELLNRYFGFMVHIIWRNEGTLDKYIGDEIMAFWNAPVYQEDHAYRAVRAALEMQRAIDRRQDEWAFLGMPNLRAGVGIDTGEVLIGYIGSEERMQYTAIGHHVNIASRLQHLTKEIGARILISADTYEQIKGQFEIDFEGSFEIRGLEGTTDVYRVMGPAGEPDYLEQQ